MGHIRNTLKYFIHGLGLVVVIIIGALSVIGSGGGEFDTGPDVTSPYNLRVTNTGVTTVELDWDYSGPVDFTTGFNIYRNGQKVSYTAGTSYMDYNLSPNTSYCYTVTAYNFWGESGHSNSVCTTTIADTASPTIPGNFVAKNTYNNEASLIWNKSFDNVEVVGYKIFRNNQYLMTVTETSAIDSGLSPGTNYCYKVTAYDLIGNESDPSNIACVDTSWHIENVSVNDKLTGVIDIAVDSNNKAHIIYVDEQTFELKYTTNSTGTWTVETIDTFIYPATEYASIALDSLNNAHVSYYDNTDTDLKYATNMSGSWIGDIVVDSYVSTTGRYNSIAIDSLNHAHISYIGSGGLRYSNNVAGSWSLSEIVDSNGTGRTSIAVDSQDNIHIAYLSNTTSSLRYTKGIPGAWTTPEQLVDYYYYQSLDMDIDPDDNVHICNADYITNKSDQWVITDAGDYYALSDCSIAAETQEHIHLSHSVTYSRTVYDPYYISYTYRDTRYTKLENGEWSTYTLNDITPWTNNSLSLSSDGAVHVVFYGLSDLGLKYVTNQ
jgi:chitodextrinase